MFRLECVECRRNFANRALLVRHTESCVLEALESEVLVLLDEGNLSKSDDSPSTSVEGISASIVGMRPILFERNRTEPPMKSTPRIVLFQSTAERVSLPSSSTDQNDEHFEEQERKQERQKVRCSECNMVVYRQNLSAHFRTHTGLQPYVCMICARKFGSSSTLRVHMRTHTGERPYSCSQCNYASTTRRNLDRHVSAIHEEETDQPQLGPMK